MSLVDVPVLVTGADGFIGSHLVERLVDEGARVRAFCLYNARGSLGWLDTVPASTRDALDVRLGDIRDAAFVAEADRGRRGGLPPRRADRDPVLLRRRRVVRRRRTSRARSTCSRRRAGPACAGFVHTSTSEVYGTPDDAADHGGAPAQRAVAVRRDQGRGRPADARLPALVRASRPWSCGRSTRSGRASRSERSCRRCSASCWPGGHEIRLGRLDPRRDLTFVADTVDGFVRAAVADGHRGPDHPARDRSSGVDRRPVRARRPAHRQRPRSRSRTPAGCAPTRARCWCSSPIPLCARELLGWQADDVPRGRPGPHDRLDPRQPGGRDRPCPALTGPAAPPAGRADRSAATRPPTWPSASRRNYVSSVGPFVDRFERGVRRRRRARGSPSPAARGPPRCTWRSRRWVSDRATRSSCPTPDVRRLGESRPLSRRDARPRRFRVRTPQPGSRARRGRARAPGRGRAAAAERRSRSCTWSGTPRTWSRSSRLPRRYGVPVVEDASEALGAGMDRGTAGRAPGRQRRESWAASASTATS